MWLGEKRMLINNEIILFHGTNILFEEIKLNKSKISEILEKDFIQLH